jgi:hypothetical protein
MPRRGAGRWWRVVNVMGAFALGRYKEPVACGGGVVNVGGEFALGGGA